MADISFLKGLNVLELSSVLAGPLVGSFFAELGAEVTKIENKRAGGDITRQWKLPIEDKDAISAYYAAANYGKKSILLDFSTEQDYRLLMDMVCSADIITTNFQKHTAEKLKVNIEHLHELNPTAIICQLNAYTYEDERPGYDMVMQAESGLLSMTGTKDGAYVKVPVAIIDVIASHQMREAILLAMLSKSKDGKGRIIHVSLYKSALTILVNQASNYLMAGMIPTTMGMQHPNIAPYGDIVLSKDDKPVVLAVGSDKQFDNMIKSLNFDVEKYAFYASNVSRVANRVDMMALLKEDFNRVNVAEITEKLSALHVPHCIVKNLDMVFKSKLAQDMILEDGSDCSRQKRVRTVAFDIQNPQ